MKEYAFAGNNLAGSGTQPVPLPFPDFRVKMQCLHLEAQNRRAVLRKGKRPFSLGKDILKVATPGYLLKQLLFCKKHVKQRLVETVVVSVSPEADHRRYWMVSGVD